MKHDIITSIIIGILAVQMPFWEWTGRGQQVFAIGGIAILTFYILQRKRIQKWILEE